MLGLDRGVLAAGEGLEGARLFQGGGRVGRNQAKVRQVLFQAGRPQDRRVFLLEISMASPKWSPCPCVTRIRSILPSLSRSFSSGGVLGLFMIQGSIMITLPPGVVSLKADWANHCSSGLPWAWAALVSRQKAATKAKTRAIIRTSPIVWRRLAWSPPASSRIYVSGPDKRLFILFLYLHLIHFHLGRGPGRPPPGPAR